MSEPVKQNQLSGESVEDILIKLKSLKLSSLSITFQRICREGDSWAVVIEGTDPVGGGRPYGAYPPGAMDVNDEDLLVALTYAEMEGGARGLAASLRLATQSFLNSYVALLQKYEGKLMGDLEDLHCEISASTVRQATK